MITFLVAGHKTTSGLLSFTFYYLLKNPTTYAKAQQEVDEAVGRGPITVDQLARLPYLNVVLREPLRLSPTVPSIALAAKENTVLGGQYYIKANKPIIAAVHRDPSVYGSDADDFRPDRMLDSEFDRRWCSRHTGLCKREVVGRASYGHHHCVIQWLAGQQCRGLRRIGPSDAGG